MPPSEEIITALSRIFDIAPQEWPRLWALMTDPAEDTIVVVAPGPCDCKMLAEAKEFPPYADNCPQPAYADIAIADYRDMEPKECENLSPADLNNVACFLIQRTNPPDGSAKEAHDLLITACKAASEDSETQKLIQANIALFEAHQPGTPRQLTAFKNMARRAWGEVSEMEAWMVEKAQPVGS